MTNLDTKWCVTDNSTPWLEFSFAKTGGNLCMFVMNAGIESTDYITSAFRFTKIRKWQLDRYRWSGRKYDK